MNYASTKVKKEKEVEEEEENKLFHLRLRGLNSWIQSYKSWKNWSQGKKEIKLDNMNSKYSCLSL
jgi:hypothetical protein